jgi:hypothetical protein
MVVADMTRKRVLLVPCGMKKCNPVRAGLANNHKVALVNASVYAWEHCTGIQVDDSEIPWKELVGRFFNRRRHCHRSWRGKWSRKLMLGALSDDDTAVLRGRANGVVN